MLEPFERRLVLLHLFSASGPFLTTLSKENRVIVSATRGTLHDALPPAAREKRAELEAAIHALRQKKKELAEDAYYAELEKLLREMAELYREAK